jgi:hypothetical protein
LLPWNRQPFNGYGYLYPVLPKKLILQGTNHSLYRLSTFQCKAIWVMMAFWVASSAMGQGYAYRRYDIKDGLVGNHVYHTVQDKEGFIWFATETGVSRFDGTRFTNFTTDDGLPDNEIIQLFADSKGRVWIVPFKNELCYYYKGKIYNAHTDSMLRAMKLPEFTRGVFEDDRQNIIILYEGGLFILHHDQRISHINRYKGQPLQVNAGGCDYPQSPYIFAVVMEAGQATFTGLRLQSEPQPRLTIEPVQGTRELIGSVGMRHFGLFHQGIIMPIEAFYGKKSLTHLQYWAMNSYRRDTIAIPSGFNRVSFNKTGKMFINSSHGVSTYDFNSRRLTDVFLPEQNVSCTMDDNEGNRWFTTLGNGVFRLLSQAVKKVEWGTDCRSITALAKLNNRMVAGSDKGNRFYSFDAQTGGAIRSHTLPKSDDYKILGISSEGGKVQLLLSWALVETDSQYRAFKMMPTMQYALSYKDAVPLGNGRFLFATHVGAFTIDRSASRSSMRQVVFYGRSTAVCAAHGGTYVGTLHGLYFIDSANRQSYLGASHGLLGSRITKLLHAANRLWVGTNDNGVVCYDGQRVIKNVSAKTGLTGSIVRALHANGDYLWVGTDRGLNKINMADTGLPIVAKYTAMDGLASDMINAVYAHQNMVYVGTPEGLNFFDETKIAGESQCNLRLLGIIVSGRERSLDSGRLYLHNRENDIRFSFVGISYKSDGDISYKYRLLGIDDEWRSTRNNLLQYPALPSGSYELQLMAVNRFGIESQVQSIPFTIQQKLIEENWFRVMVLLAAIGLAWAITSWRIRRIRRRYREKMETSNRIAALEQQALKAQMNPHFIFNCLNSIQQYVMDKDVMGANKFITGFSRLIRQTLENSSKQLISVGEEEAFLSAYLALEKMRFEGRFDYSITVDPAIGKEEVFLPPMLLQPYVENSIRHGVRLKKDSKGQIDINILLAANRLICVVADNGVGRAVAQQYKSSQHIEYQSKGMLLTSQRIALFNMDAKHDIALQVEDMKDAQGMATGTKITISLPV